MRDKKKVTVNSTCIWRQKCWFYLPPPTLGYPIFFYRTRSKINSSSGLQVIVHTGIVCALKSSTDKFYTLWYKLDKVLHYVVIGD